VAFANKAIGQFNRHPVNGALDGKLTADEKAKFDELEEATDPVCPSTKASDGFNAPSFGEGSIEFRTKLNGQLVIGKTGHSSIGWRVYDDWILGLWRLESNRLGPIGWLWPKSIAVSSYLLPQSTLWRLKNIEHI
jgi:hypothetical protein